MSEIAKIDTTKEGFEYAGINLTEQQYRDLIALNMQMQLHQDIPVFSMMMLLKVLGILPTEMVNNNGNDIPESDFEQWHQRRYGKRKE